MEEKQQTKQQSDAGDSAEDHQKYRAMFNALIDEKTGEHDAIERIYRDSKLVSIRSRWRGDHEEDDSREFIDKAFAGLAEEHALESQKISKCDDQPSTDSDRQPTEEL